jgi:thioredoxin reductase (NADPH)
MYDIIIIGKGPAGISAAIYGVRANRKVLVIAKDFGWLAKTDKIENYYGFENPISGMDLLTAGIKQAERLGVEFADGEVVGIENYDGFKVKTLGAEFESKAVILATGMPRKKSQIKNLTDYEGRGVGYCAICDAFFYRGKAVAVAGNADYAYEEASELLPFTKNLTIYTNGREYTGTAHTTDNFDENIKLDKRKIDHLEGEEKLERIVFDDGSFALTDGFFVAEGTAGAMDFAYKLGLENDGKTIKVAKNQSTNVPGFFAAGDCVGGILQISVAVSEGATAGLSAIEFLKQSEK